MRQLLFVIVCVLLIFNPTFGQKEKRELILLRAVLGVSKDAPVAMKSSGGLPAVYPLKLYVTTNADAKVRNNLLKWLHEWNEGDGLKYGLVEVVTDFSTADAALVRITDFKIRMGEHETTFGGEAEVNPATRKVEITSTNATKFVVYVYSYIFVKESGQLKAVRRNGYPVEVNSTLRTIMDGSFDAMVRAQHDVAKAVREGTFNAKVRKDKKLAGDWLRDELFKLLKARSKKSNQS